MQSRNGVGDLSRKEKAQLAAIIFIFLTCIGLLFYDTLLLGAAAPIAYMMLRKRAAEVLADRRKKKIRREFKDVMYSFSASFSTDRGIREAMEEAATYITKIYGKESLLAPELREMMFRIDTGASEAGEWSALAGRCEIEDISDLAAVLTGCRDAGGDMTRAVDRAAGVISEKLAAEEEIRAGSAQKKAEGALISVMPAFIIIFLRLTSPDYIEPMYRTLAGRVIMTAALAGTAAAAILTKRITDINV